MFNKHNNCDEERNSTVFTRKFSNLSKKHKIITISIFILFVFGIGFYSLNSIIKDNYLTDICIELESNPDFDESISCYMQSLTTSDGKYEAEYLQKFLLSKKEISDTDIQNVESYMGQAFYISGLDLHNIKMLDKVFERYFEHSQSNIGTRHRLINTINYLSGLYSRIDIHDPNLQRLTLADFDNAYKTYVTAQTKRYVPKYEDIFQKIVPTANASEGEEVITISSNREAINYLGKTIVKYYARVIKLENDFNNEYINNNKASQEDLALNKAILRLSEYTLYKLMSLGENHLEFAIKLARFISVDINLKDKENYKRELAKYNFVRATLNRSFVNDHNLAKELCPIYIDLNKDEIRQYNNRFQNFSKGMQQALQVCVEAYQLQDSGRAGFILLSILPDDDALIINDRNKNGFAKAVIVSKRTAEATISSMISNSINEYAPNAEYVEDLEKSKKFLAKLEAVAKYKYPLALLSLARGYATGKLPIHFYGKIENLPQNEKPRYFVIEANNQKALRFYQELEQNNKISYFNEEDFDIYSNLLLEKEYYNEIENLLTPRINKLNNEFKIAQNQRNPLEIRKIENKINSLQLSLATAYCMPKDINKNTMGTRIISSLLQKEDMNTMQKVVAEYLKHKRSVIGFYNCKDVDAGNQIQSFDLIPPSIEMLDNAIENNRLVAAAQIYNSFLEGINCLSNEYDYDTVRLHVANKILAALIEAQHNLDYNISPYIVEQFNNDLQKVIENLSSNINRLSKPKIENNYVNFADIMIQEISIASYNNSLLNDLTNPNSFINKAMENNSTNENSDKVFLTDKDKKNITPVKPKKPTKVKSAMFNSIYNYSRNQDSLIPLKDERILNVDSIHYLVNNFRDNLDALSPIQIAKLYDALVTWHNSVDKQKSIIREKFGDKAYEKEIASILNSIDFPIEYECVLKQLNVKFSYSDEARKYYETKLAVNENVELLLTSNLLANEYVKRILNVKTCEFGTIAICKKANEEICVPGGTNFPKIQLSK